MTTQELTRLEIIQKIKDKRLTQKKASEILGLCVRQIKRLCQRYQIDDAKGLISRQRGAKSNHRLPEEIKEQAIKIIREKYWDFGPTLTHEKLVENHGFYISTTTVRNIMIANRIWIPNQIKKKIVHPLRERRRSNAVPKSHKRTGYSLLLH